MIPIQLTIEGLYSYQERQTIDFSNLIDAGLFGIFGAVGSGKSSILEAITFALFGETERLNARDKRTYNMMNLKSNRSYIEFDFINYENKVFRAMREFKRNSKRFEDVKSPTVVFFEKINDEWIPLNHSNAEQLLGLSYSNFKRTIIIPQGQFKEFIELGATERTKMMKEIFNLHHYDLQDKVAVLAKKNQSNFDQLEGKLSGFEEVSEENIQSLETVVAELVEIQKSKQTTYNEVHENFQRLKVLKTDFETLKNKKELLVRMTQQKESMDEQKNQLERFELIYKAFNQLLIDSNKIELEIKSKQVTKISEEQQLQLIVDQIKMLEQKIAEIQPSFDQLPQKKLEESELEIIARTLNFSKEIEVLKERTSKGLIKVEEVKVKEKSIESTIKSLDNEWKELNQNRVDPQLLMEISEWFSKTQTLQKSLEQQTLKLTELKNQTLSIHQLFEEKNLSVSTFEVHFQSQIELIEKERKALDKTYNELEVQKRIAEYAHELHEGSPCPLCGSTSHPKVAEIADVAQQFIGVEAKITLAESRLKEIQQEFLAFQKRNQQIQLLTVQFDAEQKQLTDLQAQIELHKQTFRWKDFDPKNIETFEEKKKNALAIEKSIESIQKEIAKQRELIEVERLNLDKFKLALEQFKVEEAQKLAQIEENKSHLKVLNWLDFERLSFEEVVNQLENLRNQNQKIEKDYVLFTTQYNELNPKVASQQKSIEIITEQIKQLQLSKVELELQLQNALNTHEIYSLDEVQTILNLQLDVVKIRQEIEAFTIQFETLKNSIQELETKLAQVSFEEDKFEEQQEKLIEITALLKEANDNVTKTNAEIVRLKTAFESKKELLKELEQIQKRAANLQTLRNLFTGAGFVQYVSSIYLKQLCDNANVRFHRMTRNQLSLQINENNEFEIIDYLNEGRARSVKTLSGGQSFQVSLSLALALAESVQANSKAERNFFFIDEGFGTQDAEAVNIVFETLNHLHKENRIVGIISHVEELKERIPVALAITKDEEKGSQISLV